MDFQAPILPPAFEDLWKPAQYKGYYGGRGAAKTHSYARALITYAHTQRERILCTRQIQNSIKDSVHRILCDVIVDMNLQEYFSITTTGIYGLVSGSEFIYKGLEHAPKEIKSTEGITKVWIAEAQTAKKEALRVLLPTIRKRGSEVWAEWNTESVDDPIYDLLVTHTPPNSIVKMVNYYDNPYFDPIPGDPSPLELQRRYALSLITNARDEDEKKQAQADYDNIWEGAPRNMHMASIMRSRTVFEDFDTPEDARFFHGLDFGFANDPSALIRCFEKTLDNGKKELYIDQEVFGYGVEIDDLPSLLRTISTTETWPIKADSSRPETISYLKRQNFDIKAAEKWPGSVEDGITYMKGYHRIIIHSRCPNMRQESKNYKWKQDKVTGEILPVPIDAHNHGWDSTRYALDKVIKKKKAGWFDVD